jgi:hypothetical protein
MADQSNLTIGGIGGDPSGSHPIGNLNVNWSEAIDDSTVKFTANTIMADPGASSADATDTYYSEVLCIGPLNNGMSFEIGDTGDAQITACWQWYNPATSGVDADFVAGAALGTAGTFGNGTWTDIGTAAQDYATNYLTPEITADALAIAKGSMLRVKMVVTDAGSNGVAAGLVTAGVAAVNAAFCTYPLSQEAKYNKPIVALGSEATAGSIGGIGADPS